MFRLRITSLVVAGGLGMVSGCMNWCPGSWFHRHHGEGIPAADCCAIAPGCSTPIADTCGPMLPPPPNQLLAPPPGLAPQNTVPQLTPAPSPRLVPQPQSRTYPYTP